MVERRQEDLEWISLLGPGPKRLGFGSGRDIREPLPEVAWLDDSEKPAGLTVEMVQRCLRVRMLLWEVADLVNALGAITLEAAAHPDATTIAWSLGDIRATVLSTLSALTWETDPVMQRFWEHREQRITMGRDRLVACLNGVTAADAATEPLPLINAASHGVSGLYEDMLK